MPIRYIDEIKDLKGKKVFIRVDFNVPQDDNGAITEDTRIVGAVPTIKYALEQGAKVVLASHLGRPKGEKKAKYSMAPATARLSELQTRYQVGAAVGRALAGDLACAVERGEHVGHVAAQAEQMDTPFQAISSDAHLEVVGLRAIAS